MSTTRTQQFVTKNRDYRIDLRTRRGKGCSEASVPATIRSCFFKTCANFPHLFNDRFKYFNDMLELQDENPCAVELKKFSPYFRSNLVMPKYGEMKRSLFRKPNMPLLKLSFPAMQLKANSEFDCDSFERTVEEAEARCCGVPDRMETKQTQTDYRESEAQTSPWTPPYKVRPDENPEVLTIAHLTWGHGLPAGVHEIEIINRMRMKRAWEAILPPMDNEVNVKTRTKIIEALEIDDWAFREAEIQFIMDMRMELMEKYTALKKQARDKKDADRYDKFEKSVGKIREKEVGNIRQRLCRELRKLAARYSRGDDKWANKCNKARGIGEAISKRRGGRNVKREYHEIINQRILKDKNIPDLDDECRRLNLPTDSQLKTVKPKQKISELCVRETRWNDEKLKQLHDELKSIRMDLKQDKEISLIKRRYKLPPMPVTPVLYGARNVSEKKEQAAVFIQKLVMGRAIQCVMFEGRDRCRELVEELQSTHWLQLDRKKQRQSEKRHVIGIQRDQNRRLLQEDRLSEVLNRLEGMTVAGMLDFLSKELVRLRDERKAHAFALLAERQRAKREAEEAGRRQLEEQRRREHDEMFRQIIKVDQDSVELYLEDIIKEGIEFVSESQAREYIEQTADKVDEIARYTDENAKELAEEEMVCDMIYNFVLPEAEKEIVRKRMRQRQESYLTNAHAVIYDKILELPPIEQSQLTTDYSNYTEEDTIEEGEEKEMTDDLSSEASIDWIKREIIGNLICPEELLDKATLSEGEKLVNDLRRDIVKEVEALVENVQLSRSISARSSASGSSASSYSSESSGKTGTSTTDAAGVASNEVEKNGEPLEFK